MRKKMICLFTVLIGLILSAPVIYGDNINVNDTITFSRGPGNGPGGVFNIYDSTTNYSFPSFCVETNEYINYNSQAFKVGGITGMAIANGGDTAKGYIPALGGDPLDIRTAYLYYNFRMGTLSGWDGSNAMGDALQNTIWFIEQEITTPLIGQALTWFNAANNSGWTTDYHGVAVLNVLTQVGGIAQDQLVLVPEPSTLLLLGAGLLGLGIMVRRRKK